MQSTRTRAAWVLSLISAALLAALATISPAQQPAPAKKTETTTPAKNAEPQKRFAFEMREKPWAQVFDWLTDNTGLPVIASQRPTGTFSYFNPRGPDGKPLTYTIPEVIDIINEGMLAGPETQQYVLIRRQQSFTLIPANQKIDPVLLQRIPIDELPTRGKSEIVSIILPMKTLVAEDVAPTVKKILGPFGEVVAIPEANQLYMQDTVGNLERIVKTVKDIEQNEQAQTFYHQCKYVKARDAEQVLRSILGDPERVIALTARSAPPINLTFNPLAGGETGGMPGRGSDGGPGSGGQGGRSRFGSSMMASAPVKLPRMHYVTSDERTNTVLVSGPADKIAQAKAVMEKLDVPQGKGQQPVLVGNPFVQTYAVPGGNAEAIAKNLQDIYKGTSSLRIAAVGNGSIMVFATPEDQFEIAKQIQGTRVNTGTTELIPVGELDATAVAKTLQGMYGDTKTGAPYVEADTGRNGIIVKGTADQLVEVKEAIRAMGGSGGVQSGKMRIITLDKGSASTLAEALQRMMSEMRKNPIRVIDPNNSINGAEPSPAPKAKEKPSARENSFQRDAQGELHFVSQQLADPQQDKQEKKADKNSKDNRPGRSDMPVNITAYGNKLIVTSDDPEALALVSELVRLLTQTQAGEGDFQILHLKNASAAQAAQVLDELFNGPKEKTPQQNTSRFGGFGGGFGGRGSPFGGAPTSTTTATEPRKERIRVVADPGTNSLLVRANPLDMLTIRGLLSRAIDTADNDSRAVMRTHVIGPLVHARAAELYQVVKDVFRESINQNPSVTTVGGFPGIGFFGQRSQGTSNVQNVDANGNPVGVTLSLGVDDQTNSLVVHCSEPMYEDINKLVKLLDKAAGDSNRTVKVMSIKGVDPMLMQQAIDAIQGRRSTSSTSGRPGTTGSAPGFVPTGTGGFITPGGGSGGGGYGGGRGGGGGGGRGGGGYRGGGGSTMLERGPDFFAQRVKDDPKASVLFDPQRDVAPETESNSLPDHGTPTGESRVADSELGADLLQPVHFEEQQAPPGQAGPDSGAVKAPRSPVQAEALEQLGVIVISGNNAADVEEVVRIIEYIQKLGAGADVEIRMVPLKQADAVSVANTLTQLYLRVLVGPTSTSISSARPSTPTGGGTGAFPGGFPGAGTQATTPGLGAATGLTQGAGAATQQGFSSVVFLALPRFNAIFVAAPKARIEDMVQKVSELDRPIAPQTRGTPFPLHQASASTVATMLTSYFATRYPGETQLQNMTRFTADVGSNTLWVQAAPADLAEIRDFITWVDNNTSRAKNDLRVIPLRNAVSDDLAALLGKAISEGTVPPGATTTPGLPGAFPGALTPAALAARAATTAGTQAATKNTALRFFSSRKESPNVFEAGVLADVYINSDPRTNSLLISAPAESMKLILAVVAELDVAPLALANINIYTLKRADASAIASMLQQLFLGTGAPASATTGAKGPTGFPGAAPGATSTTTAAPLQISLGNETVPGAPIIPVRVTVDALTNSLIVVGSRNDLDVVHAVVARLDNPEARERKNEVYQLHYSIAADVAVALTTFIPQVMGVYTKAGAFSTTVELQNDVIVVPEPITNKLLISASPRYFDEVMQLVANLDVQPAQVVIQCLVAEVDLNGSEEFGVEIGGQSPVLFQRGIFPLPNLFGTGTTTFTPTPTSLPTGTALGTYSASSTINQIATPGFQFNSPLLGNNPAASPGVVGFQGLSSLGVGRVSSTGGPGGFVFSAGSDTFNILVRALRTQGRMDILSRPQITTTDNQTGSINIGLSYPYTTGSISTTAGVGVGTSVTVAYKPVGVLMQVTPKINPDGSVVMRITPEISSVSASVNLGNGQMAPSFTSQMLDTTVIAMDGETVAIGGMIQKTTNKNQTSVPWLGDLPVVGALFRYRTETKAKTELLIIMTPHVVRCAADRERIMAMEGRRMDWVLGDVLKVQGTSGMEPLMPAPKDGLVPPGAACPDPGPLMHVDPPPTPGPELIVPPPPPVPATESLPRPRPLPQTEQSQANELDWSAPVTLSRPAAGPDGSGNH